MASPTYNKEHRQWVSSKIVALAQSVLAGQLGIVAASRQLSAWRFDVGAEHDPDFTFFVGVDSETDHLPVGEERQHWNPDALRTKDEELRAFEASVRERALEVCRSLIQKYETHVA